MENGMKSPRLVLLGNRHPRGGDMAVMRETLSSGAAMQARSLRDVSQMRLRL